MTDKSIRKNYIYNLTYQILLLITPLITTPYLARVLEADGIGTFSFIDSIVVYFSSFASLGIGTFGQREVAYFRDNIKERSRIFWELKALSVINITIVTAIYLIFVYFYAEDNIALYLIMVLRLTGGIFDASWFFAGMEEFRKIVVRNIIVKILDIAFIFLFIKQKTDLALHVFGVYFFIILGSVSLLGYLPAYIDKPDIKSLRPYRNIKTIWSMFIPTIAILIYTTLDRIMLGIFTQGALENGYYEQCMRITRITLMFVTSLGSVMIPRIGYLFGRNEHDRIELYMYRSYRFVLFLAVPSFLGLCAVSGNLVPWFFGAGYDKVSGLLKISGMLFIAIGISNVTGIQYLIPTSRQNIYTLTVLAGAVLNFTLNIFLIRFFMSYGALTASVIAESFIAALQLYILRGELSFRKIISSGKNYYISGLIMFGVLEMINKNLLPSAVNTLILIITGSAIYSVMLIVLRDEFFIDSLHRFAGCITKKIHRS